MKSKKTLCFLAILTFLTSCNKEENLTISEPSKISKMSLKTLKEASALHGNLFVDSLIQLRNDYDLADYDKPIDNTKVLVQKFDDVASAREFISNFSKSEIVNDKKPITNFKISANFKETSASTKIDNEVSMMGIGSGWAPSFNFEFTIPNRTFRFVRWTWNSPVGFVVTGEITGYDPMPVSVFNNQYRFERWELKSMTSALYGLTAMTAYTPGTTSFFPWERGWQGSFRFNGVVSLVLDIRGTGQSYSFPITAEIRARMGPFSRTEWGDYDGRLIDGHIISHYVSRY